MHHFKRLPLLLPVIMLALAALACDGPGPDYQPVRITRLEADRTTPGKAYIFVEGYRERFSSSDSEKLGQVYETANYGESWQLSSRPAIELPESPQDNPSMRGDHEQLFFGEQEIWHFPRGTFRSFFNEVEFEPFPLTTAVSSFNSVSPADPDVIWVIVPEQGILIGPNLDRPAATRTWRLTNVGIDLLHPTPLTIKNPLVILAVVLAGLFVPPLPVLHRYVMRHVYHYAVDPSGEARVTYWANVASVLLTVLSAVAIVIWLVDEWIDLSDVTIPMALVAAVMATSTAVSLAQANDKSTGFTIKLALAALLTSLIIPIGVILTPVGWFIILPLLICYEFGVGLIVGCLRRHQHTIPRWQIDLFGVGFSVALNGLVISTFFQYLFLLALVCLGLLIVIVLVALVFAKHYRGDIVDTVLAIIAAGLSSLAVTFVMLMAEIWAQGFFVALARR